MRLSAAQIEAIKQETAHFFGAQAEVWLFGSRVDDTQRGGDVDLYVKSGMRSADQSLQRALRFWRNSSAVLAMARLIWWCNVKAAKCCLSMA
ncbi:MAG: nucleotidyltransferase domain-containing protein [Sideroxyarcus sp.]|nr:nucleotidyltransferase domain-containing protein [Sideroxyarcus sp.]